MRKFRRENLVVVGINAQQLVAFSLEKEKKLTFIEVTNVSTGQCNFLAALNVNTGMALYPKVPEPPVHTWNCRNERHPTSIPWTYWRLFWAPQRPPAPSAGLRMSPRSKKCNFWFSVPNQVFMPWKALWWLGMAFVDSWKGKYGRLTHTDVPSAYYVIHCCGSGVKPSISQPPVVLEVLSGGLHKQCNTVAWWAKLQHVLFWCSKKALLSTLSLLIPVCLIAFLFPIWK